MLRTLFTQRLHSYFVRMRHLSHLTTLKIIVINNNISFNELFIYKFAGQLTSLNELHHCDDVAFKLVPSFVV